MYMYIEYTLIDEESLTATPKTPQAPSLKRLDAISVTPTSSNWPFPGYVRWICEWMCLPVTCILNGVVMMVAWYGNT